MINISQNFSIIGRICCEIRVLNSSLYSRIRYVFKIMENQIEYSNILTEIFENMRRKTTEIRRTLCRLCNVETYVQNFEIIIFYTFCREIYTIYCCITVTSTFSRIKLLIFWPDRMLREITVILREIMDKMKLQDFVYAFQQYSEYPLGVRLTYQVKNLF